ncbi:MAG: VWA domain-containing protein [Myxococcales bacterium]|nr:VWA domain-containing protein [Myxococcales bacterium]
MSRVARTSLPWSMVALLAMSAAGCSSYDEAMLSGGAYEDDDWNGVDDPSGGEGGGGDEGPAGGGDEPAGGDDGGGEPPPAEPDDDGVDNGAGEAEVCDASQDVTLYLSPDDSNSMSSPVQARSSVLDEWGGVQMVAIRTWEFFNYYHFGYPAAEAGTLAVHPSLQEGEAAGEYLLQIGVSSEEIADEARAPINITLVLDTSGSMAGEPMEMLKESCRAIAASLREGDTISMVTWATDDAQVLGGHVVAGPDDPVLLAKIDALEASGGTDLHGGLVAGYELAQQVFDAGRINRIVLVSDGGANAGITDIELIAEHAGAANQHGIYMVGVGVGDALGYHDDLMDLVTDAGKGASVFIPSADEAWKVFNEDFGATLAVAARDVRVQLDLPPGFEIVSTSAEEVSLDAAEVEPQHLAPNDAMVFHQRIRTCAPELIDAQSTVTVTVSYLDALSFEPEQVQLSRPLLELLEADQAPLLKGAAVFAYAEGLKAYKQADLGGRSATMSGALAALERAEAVLPDDPELAEIRAVLEALALR